MTNPLISTTSTAFAGGGEADKSATIRLPVVVVVLTMILSLIGLPSQAAAESAQWEHCSRLGFVNESQRRFDDPLHWHFGRVANLTVGRYGRIRPLGQAPANFDNFGVRAGKTLNYADAGGTVWVLQSPQKSRFHQPKIDNWVIDLLNPVFTKPPNRGSYPNRKFVSVPDDKNRSFELILIPDHPNVRPYTYDQQRVLWNGRLAGTFNYSTTGLGHVLKDVRPHNKLWKRANGAQRKGETYQPVRSQNILRQRPNENAKAFQRRISRLADDLDLLVQATSGSNGQSRWALDVHPTEGYRLISLRNGRVTRLSRELDGAIDRFREMYGVSCEDQPICGDWQRGSGDSVEDGPWLQGRSGDIWFSFDGYIFPDRFKVFFRGQLLYDSGGDTVADTVRIGVPTNRPLFDEITVEVTGNSRYMSYWRFAVGCPGGGKPRIQTVGAAVEGMEAERQLLGASGSQDDRN